MVAACLPSGKPSPPASIPDEAHVVVEERGEQSDRVGPATHARDRDVGQGSDELEALGPRLVADAAGEVAHHRREGMRPGRGPEQVGRVVDAGHPVAQGLVDRVLEGAASGRDRDDLGTQHPHAGDVERLPFGVDLAHVDRALEVEVGAGGGGGDAVLAGAGLRDGPRLADALGQQCLTEHVADLVGTGVVEVLALEQDAGSRRLREASGVVEQAGDAGVLAQHPVELGHEHRVGLRLGPGPVELVEWRDQRLGHEAAAEGAEVAGGVRLGVGHRSAFRRGGGCRAVRA